MSAATRNNRVGHRLPLAVAGALMVRPRQASQDLPWIGEYWPGNTGKYCKFLLRQPSYLLGFFNLGAGGVHLASSAT